MEQKLDPFPCLCGCGNLLSGSRKYKAGHKPKRKKLEGEALLEMHRRRGEKLAAHFAAKRKPLNPCACGCGQQVKGKWAWGHHSRVNNISKREDIRATKSDFFRKLHADGKTVVWNRGKTKETDDRVAKNGEERSRVFTEEERKMHSRLMRNHRLDGTIPTLRGPDHPQWKGGTSTITQRLRGNHRLYVEWKRPILYRDGYMCVRCKRGSGPDVRLAVHHDKERFADIISQILLSFFGGSLPDREMTWEESTEICERVIEYHLSSHLTGSPVSGVTLCYDCHDDVHSSDSDRDID